MSIRKDEAVSRFRATGPCHSGVISLRRKKKDGASRLRAAQAAGRVLTPSRPAADGVTT